MTNQLKKLFTITTIMLMIFTWTNPLITAAYEIVGEPEHPSLTIFKYEQDPDAQPEDNNEQRPNIPSDAKPLPDVTYEIKLLEEYIASENDWQPTEKDLTLQKTTDQEGKIVFTESDGLILGKYSIQEIDAPAHVIMDSEVYTVDIPMTTKDGSLYYDVHVHPKNETIYGDLELIKLDETGQPLKDISFILYKVETDTEEKIETLATDDTGKISVEGLKQGYYYFQETSRGPHENIALNNQKIYFEIESGKQNSIVWTPIKDFVDENGVVTNYEEPTIDKKIEEDLTEKEVSREEVYNYTIKVNTPGDITNYELLAITDELDERIEFTGDWEVNGTTKDNMNLTVDGQLLKWTVKDLNLLQPNSELKITFSAKVRKDAQLKPDETGIPNDATLDFDNGNGWYTVPKDGEEPPTNPPTTPPVIVYPIDGNLKIIKVDKSDKSLRLENAQFKITTDKKGENIVESTKGTISVNGASHDGKLEHLATKTNGEILIEGLEPGTYYVHETKAPTYVHDGKTKSYRMLTAPVKVEVEGNTLEEITIENSKSLISIPKTGGLGTIIYLVVGLIIISLSIYGLRKEKKPVTN